MHKGILGKISGLSRRDRLALIELVWVYLWVEAGLRTLPFNRMIEGMLRTRRLPSPDEPLDSRAGLLEFCRLAEAVFRRFPYRVTCLKKALVLQKLLGRRGIRAVLKIGVRKDETDLKAHAWLEHGGEILINPMASGEEFKSILSFGGVT
jgi:Transglutaminase-like superfamily